MREVALESKNAVLVGLEMSAPLSLVLLVDLILAVLAHLLLIVEILLMQMLRPLNCLVLHEKLRLRFNLGEVLLNGRALRVQDLLVQVVDVLGLVIGGDADKHWLQLV